MLRRLRAFLWGASLGAGAMYLFDPERGNRRQALVRDQLNRTLNRTDDLINKGTRDLSNRASGMIAEMRGMVSREQVSDETLAQRVRSKIGTIVSHPRAIQVTVRDGRVELSGPVLAQDVQPLLARAGTIRGVKGVDNRLEVHDQPGEVQALQGEPAQSRAARMQGAWTPGPRLLITAGGLLMALSGLRRGGVMGTLRTLFGISLFTRGLANRGFGQLLGLTEDGNTISIHNGIQVNAPVEEVFGFWQNFANFPQFMANLHEVRDLGNGRSHWVAAGPAGAPVEWDAIITNMAPNQMIAWESTPDSQVKQNGLVRFASTEGGGTHVNVQMFYTPPAGVLGHVVASFFGSNPKQAMDEDLIRFRSLIERGKTSTPAGTVTREQVENQDAQQGQTAAETRAEAYRPISQGQARAQDKAGQADTQQPGETTPERTDRAAQERDNWVDEVGRSGVFPASAADKAPADAEAQGMASWGQGERGAAGYEDSGSSELSGLGEETDFGSVIPGPAEEPEDEQ